MASSVCQDPSWPQFQLKERMWATWAVFGTLYSLLSLGSNWQLRQCELASLHSGETTDLRGSLGSDAQTVTALALCQASLVWPSTAMVSLGYRHSSLMLGAAFFLLLRQPCPWAMLAPKNLGNLKGRPPDSLLLVCLPASQPQGG